MPLGSRLFDAITELAPLVPRLEVLELDRNPLGDAGARALAAAGPRCKELALTFTGLGPEGLAALVDAGVLAGMDSLPLTGNPLGDAGAGVPARLAPRTGGLAYLNLGWTGLSSRGLAVLLDSGLFDAGIEYLSLRGNPLGEAGLRLLAEHPRLPVAVLTLDDGPPALIEALRARTRVIAVPRLDDDRVLACPYCYEALDQDLALCPLGSAAARPARWSSCPSWRRPAGALWPGTCQATAPAIEPFEAGTPEGMGAYADALVELLDAAGLERAVLAGHSMGGMVALQTAAQHPDRVSGLVLVCCTPAFGASAGPLQQAFLAKRLGPLDAGASMRELAIDLIPGMVGPGGEAEMVHDAVNLMEQIPPDSYRRALRAVVGFDQRPLFTLVDFAGH